MQNNSLAPTSGLTGRRFHCPMLSRISRGLVLWAVAAIVATSGISANDSWAVREDGAGPIKIGMSLSQLNTVLKEKFTMLASKDEQACFYETPKEPDVPFMIIKGRLARIDVQSPNVPTSTGIRVGDSEAHVLKVYGQQLKVEPHAYTAPEGHYLTKKSSHGRYGIRFETDGKKITMFYAGRFDAIQYIEGCE